MGMNMVSIIMPAYNAEKTILKSIQSVVEQSFTDWELIIVEDCSRDKTPEIVQEFVQKYENKLICGNQRNSEDQVVKKKTEVKEVQAGRNDIHKDIVQKEIPRKDQKEDSGEKKIRLLRNEVNRGVAFSRNRGVEAAQGEWIAFLDSDDMWTPDKLEKQMKYIREHDLREGLCFTGSSFITEDDKKLDYILHVPGQIDRAELLKQNVISCSSVIVSRNLVRKYKFPENIKTIHEDFVVWLNILGEPVRPAEFEQYDEVKANADDTEAHDKTDGQSADKSDDKSVVESENNRAKSKRSEKVRVAYGIDEPLLTYRIAAGSKSGKKSKAAVMNWNTYRYVGLNCIESFYYMIHYSIRGILKWRKIKKHSA